MPFDILTAAGGLLALILAGAVALWRARAKWLQEGTKAAADYRDTRRRMDDATGDLGADPSVLRDWLRARGDQSKRDL